MTGVRSALGMQTFGEAFLRRNCGELSSARRRCDGFDIAVCFRSPADSQPASRLADEGYFVLAAQKFRVLNSEDS
jgi:hypothetical protein